MTETLLAIALLTATLLLLSFAVLSARSWLLPTGAISVTINGGKKLTAHSGSKLLGVLLDNGVSLPAACGGNGTCGLCRVVVKDGGGLPLSTETARLSRQEIHEGWRLACQVGLRSDLSVKVPDALLGAASKRCTVRSSRTLSPLIKELVFSLPEGEGLGFRPGAFVQVTAPPYQLPFAGIEIDEAHEEDWARMGFRELHAGSENPVKRAYSIANSAEQEDCIVLLVRLAVPPPAARGIPPGVVSSYLFGVRPGDVVEVEGPFGEFAASEGDREMVVIGGGVGMAPLRAIISDQLADTKTSRRISFWYGARSGVDLFYVDEFDELAALNANFDWTATLSDPQSQDEWNGPTGFVHDVVFKRYLRDHPAPEECEYYLCGPPLMIKAVLAMLDQLGVEDDSIFFDDFGS